MGEEQAWGGGEEVTPPLEESSGGTLLRPSAPAGDVELLPFVKTGAPLLLPDVAVVSWTHDDDTILVLPVATLASPLQNISLFSAIHEVVSLTLLVIFGIFSTCTSPLSTFLYDEELRLMERFLFLWGAPTTSAADRCSTPLSWPSPGVVARPLPLALVLLHSLVLDLDLVMAELEASPSMLLNWLGGFLLAYIIVVLFLLPPTTALLRLSTLELAMMEPFLAALLLDEVVSLLLSAVEEISSSSSSSPGRQTIC